MTVSKKPRLAAATILAATVVAATAVVVRTTSDTPSAPSAPGLVAKRPVKLLWAKVPGATSYRIWRDGVVIKTVTGLSTTVYISCTGNSLHRLNVQAQNAAGKSSMKPPVWRAC